jgi:phosphoribosylformylglycinamidine synthase subunit PurS
MPEFRAVVHVMLRRSILDPQGRAVEGTLHRLGHVGIADVRVGKRIELTLAGERDAVLAELRQVAERVLSNPVMEDVELELHEIQEA